MPSPLAPPFFVFDVESIGLHGEGFAVAGGIYPGDGSDPLEEFLFACPPDVAQGSEVDRRWVADHVPPLSPTHADPRSVRGAFWSRWIAAKVRFPGITAWAECGWPVEARFLAACADDDPANRAWEGPFPLHELATLLEASGIDTPPDAPILAHHPLHDARLSARKLAAALHALALQRGRPAA